MLRLAHGVTAALLLGPLVAPAAPDRPVAGSASPVAAASELWHARGEEVVETWPDGSPRRVFTRDEEGRFDGPYLEYFQSGELAVRTRYAKGELSGRHETFFENGERHLDVRYSRGRLDGRYQEYDERGRRRVTGSYSDGAKDGDFEIRRDGEVVSRQVWRDGVLTELDGLEGPVPRPAGALAADLVAIERLVIEPDLESEFEGAIDPALANERIAALKRLMEYRALCGLVWADMELDPKYNWHCTAAAKLLQRIGRLDHTPKNPGLPEDEYRTAYEGTSRSNLSMGPGLVGSIDSYMDDSDPSNIDRVGHRRWCLNPAMRRTGFGIADRWSAMWSFDESRGATDWDVVAYPARGLFPSSHIVDGAAWSVRFRRAVLEGVKERDVTVELYALDEDLTRGAPMRLEHLSLDGGQVIFKGRDVVCAPGRAYEVRILLPGKRGPEELLRYYVEFVDLADALTAARAASAG
jgi:hypothetical protein